VTSDYDVKRASGLYVVRCNACTHITRAEDRRAAVQSMQAHIARHHEGNDMPELTTEQVTEIVLRVIDRLDEDIDNEVGRAGVLDEDLETQAALVRSAVVVELQNRSW
jgi:hypothetical protein